ncbi:MAG: ATP-binding cassette domain-containing protein [Holosporales bacterium]|jgi:ABC-2 type transport system ATP-binding protein|nr:ATP-binding cassette domain-containing protein [Holosporales bacterium]
MSNKSCRLPPPYAIDVRNLTKAFKGRLVVNHVDVRVQKGKIYGFLGPNGSGETTTIRMLCGLLTPDEGEGTCLGLDLRKYGRIFGLSCYLCALQQLPLSDSTKNA